MDPPPAIQPDRRSAHDLAPPAPRPGRPQLSDCDSVGVDRVSADDAVVARDLVKIFGKGPKAVRAVDGVSLQVPAGTVLGLLGPNGAGKTTTVNMLTTLTRPTSGSARVAGIDVARHPDAVRRSIGLAGQYAAIDPNLTGRENLTLVGRLNHLPRTDARRRAGELLERFGLDAAADRRTKTYSGGMRRRLDLGAALVAEPPVLFLDEPTTGLDPRSRVQLWGVIAALVADGTTVLLTTQYLEEADRLADRIVVIDHGVVIAEGTATELKGRLGATVVEAAFRDEATAGRAVAALAGIGDRGDARIDGATVRLDSSDGTRTLTEVVRALDEADLRATALGIREPSLDDVFLSLTGHRAEDAGSDLEEDE
jgi:ABC-2 type transport system ATP-binding protein